MRMSDLQAKKIIDVLTGKNLGSIVDIEVKDDGRIESLIVEQGKAFFSLNRDDNSKIAWSDITKIGEDVILVKRNYS